MGAGVLIYASFQDWHDNPVKTTIKTLPIKNIKFPKVTVCPPKNTFTDLNYDLRRTENMTLTETSRNDLVHYAVKLVDGQKVFEIMRNLSMFHEENRYYNWYHGYTVVEVPQYIKEKGTNLFDLTTGAASGCVSIKNLDQIFGSKTGDINLKMKVYLPKTFISMSGSNDIKLNLEIVRNKVKEMNESFIIGNTVQAYNHVSHVIKNVTQLSRGWRSLDVFYYASLDYKLAFNNEHMHHDKRSGITIKWYYTGPRLESAEAGWYEYYRRKMYENTDFNKEFRKFVNIFLIHQNIDNNWKNVIEISANMSEISDCGEGGLFLPEIVQKNLQLLQNILGCNTTDEFRLNITNDILNTAAEMFVYLNHCPHGGNKDWIQFYKNLFKIHEPDVILMTLNRLIKTSQRDTAKKILEYLEVDWNLKFRNITSRSASDKNLSLSVASTLR